MEEKQEANADAKLLYQGAEARILTGEFAGRVCVIKERFAKRYRHSELDLKLRRARMKAECKAIIRCMELHVRVPCIYYIDQRACSIWMERLSGPTVRQFFCEQLPAAAAAVNREINADLSETQDDVNGRCGANVAHVAELIGYSVGRMHRNGLVHGDLTTSNMILTHFGVSDGGALSAELAFIDFGLSSFDKSPESFGVDLYVLERAIISAHVQSNSIWECILNGYRRSFNETAAVDDAPAKGSKKPGTNKSSASSRPNELGAILNRYEDVRMRGRKRLMIG